MASWGVIPAAISMAAMAPADAPTTDRMGSSVVVCGCTNDDNDDDDAVSLLVLSSLLLLLSYHDDNIPKYA